MIRGVIFAIGLFFVVGCSSRSHHTDEVAPPSNNNGNAPVSKPDTGNATTSGPVNLDSNIKSLTMGGTTYDVLYTDSFYARDANGDPLEAGINPNILVDTFNEDPLFTFDGEDIELEEGEMQVIFSDSKGDWSPIDVVFY